MCMVKYWREPKYWWTWVDSLKFYLPIFVSEICALYTSLLASSLATWDQQWTELQGFPNLICKEKLCHHWWHSMLTCIRGLIHGNHTTWTAQEKTYTCRYHVFNPHELIFKHHVLILHKQHSEIFINNLLLSRVW